MPKSDHGRRQHRCPILSAVPQIADVRATVANSRPGPRAVIPIYGVQQIRLRMCCRGRYQRSDQVQGSASIFNPFANGASGNTKGTAAPTRNAVLTKCPTTLPHSSWRRSSRINRRHPDVSLVAQYLERHVVAMSAKHQVNDRLAKTQVAERDLLEKLRQSGVAQ